eukprot:10150850-Ditylum_brightwellii.AAC.1
MNGGNSEKYNEVISSVKKFQECVNKYKHVVSHYYGAKEEFWLALFMNPVYNVWDLVLVHEFGSMRGSLHPHHSDTVEHNDDSCMNEICEILADLADDIVEAVSKLEDFIGANYIHTKHFPKYNVNPLHSTAFSIWEQFIKEIEGGKQVLKEYEDNIKYADCKAEE